MIWRFFQRAVFDFGIAASTDQVNTGDCTQQGEGQNEEDSWKEWHILIIEQRKQLEQNERYGMDLFDHSERLYMAIVQLHTGHKQPPLQEIQANTPQKGCKERIVEFLKSVETVDCCEEHGEGGETKQQNALSQGSYPRTKPSTEISPDYCPHSITYMQHPDIEVSSQLLPYQITEISCGESQQNAIQYHRRNHEFHFRIIQQHLLQLRPKSASFLQLLRRLNTLDLTNRQFFQRIQEEMYKQKREDADYAQHNKVDCISKQAQGESCDCSSQNDLTVNQTTLNAHVSAFIVFRYFISTEEFDHVAALTDPKNRSSVTSDKCPNDGYNEKQCPIKVRDEYNVADCVCDCCNLKLSFEVLESSCIGQSDQVDCVVEDECESPEKREL